MKHLLLFLLASSIAFSQTPKTRADLYTEIDSTLASSTRITAEQLRGVFKNTVASSDNGLTDGTGVTLNGTQTLANKTIADGTFTGTSSFATINATTINASGLTGVIGVANGGTGAASLTANNIVLGAGTSAVTFLAPGSSGNVVTSNGTAWTSAAPAAADAAATGTLWQIPAAGDYAVVPSGWSLTGANGIPAYTSSDADYQGIVKTAGTLAIPTFSPVSGTTVAAADTITISGPASTTLKYTTDGVTDPSRGAGSTYTVPVTAAAEIRAMAHRDYYIDSAVATATYTIDSTAPELSSAAIDGTALTLTYSEAVTRGGSYSNAHIDLDMSTTGNDIAVTYVSGDGTTTHTYTAASAAVNGETVDIDFTGTANSLEDGVGNDLALITSGPVTNSTAGGGITYDTQQDFEGTGATGTGWSSVGTAGNWDYTTTVLAGSESGYLPGAFTDFTYTYSADKSTVFGKFLVQPDTARNGLNYFVRLRNSSAATIGMIQWSSSPNSGSIRIDHGTAVASTTATMAVNTTYYFWFEYTAGSSGTFKVWFNTSDSKPTGDGTKQATIAASTSGMATTEVRSVQMRNDNTAYFIFDNFELAQVAIP